jgi:hypothetical protein
LKRPLAQSQNARQFQLGSGADSSPSEPTQVAYQVTSKGEIDVRAGGRGSKGSKTNWFMEQNCADRV